MTTSKIETFNKDINIRIPDKCYMTMFKHVGSHWCFSLPIQNMYLMTLKDAEKHIVSSKEYDDNHSIKCDYKVVKIIG